MNPDIFGPFLGNADLFIEIGAASSICTRLTRQCVPEAWETGRGAVWFKRALHFFPVLAAALFLLGIWFFPSGGIVVLHAVAIGGMSGNFRDIFKASIDRLTPAKAIESRATKTTTETPQKSGGVETVEVISAEVTEKKAGIE